MLLCCANKGLTFNRLRLGLQLGRPLLSTEPGGQCQEYQAPGGRDGRRNSLPLPCLGQWPSRGYAQPGTVGRPPAEAGRRTEGGGVPTCWMIPRMAPAFFYRVGVDWPAIARGALEHEVGRRLISTARNQRHQRFKRRKPFLIPLSEQAGNAQRVDLFGRQHSR